MPYTPLCLLPKLIMIAGKKQAESSIRPVVILSTESHECDSATLGPKSVSDIVKRLLLGDMMTLPELLQSLSSIDSQKEAGIRPAVMR